MCKCDKDPSVQYMYVLHYTFLLAGSAESMLPCEDAHEPLCAVEHGVQFFPRVVWVRGEFGLSEGRRGDGGTGGEGERGHWGERVRVLPLIVTVHVDFKMGESGQSTAH